MPLTTNAKSLEAIYQPIQGELVRVEETLRTELRGVDGFLGEMTRYVSEMLGKRLRPALALFSAQAVAAAAEPVDQRVITMSASVELIHTATLIHDDVIDAASLRRGQSTVNARWGNTLSVLAGDYLYAQAFCLLSGLGSPDVLRLMARTSQRVCAGEVTQVRHQFDAELDEATYLTILREKTASLMAAACHGGALLGGAPAATARALAAFGEAFGIAFQILDDLHDIVGEEASLGKSLGTDLAQGQITLPLIVLRDAVGPAARQRVLDLMRPEANGEAAQELKALAVTHDVTTPCLTRARALVDEAREGLSVLAPSDARQGLLDLTDYIVAV